MPNAMMLKRRDIDTPEKRREYTACILGCGRTGLTHAYLFANAGFRVIYADADHRVFNQTKRARLCLPDRNSTHF